MNVGSGGGTAAAATPTAATTGAAPETTKPEEKPEEKEEASSLLSIFCLIEANLSHRSLTKIWVSVYSTSQLPILCITVVFLHQTPLCFIRLWVYFVLLEQ